MPDEIKKSNELHETDLEAAAGGSDGATVNRYDAKECGQHKNSKAWVDCEGFFGLLPCDHYKKYRVGDDLYQFICKMGIYEYQANWANANVKNRVV